VDAGLSDIAGDRPVPLQLLDGIRVRLEIVDGIPRLEAKLRDGFSNHDPVNDCARYVCPLKASISRLATR